MSRPLDNTNTTDKVVATLKPGRYLVNMSCADGSTAVVSLYRRIIGSSDDRPIASGGTAVTLIAADSAKEVLMGAEDLVIERATGTDVITVEVTNIPY